MSDTPPFNQRRKFLKSAATACAAWTVLGQGRGDAADTGSESPVSQPDGPWLRKTLKGGMLRVGSGKQWEPKFEAAIEAGFEGVELSTGNLDVADAVQAAGNTGLIIDGTVGGYHWKTTHTAPDAATRARANALLVAGLRQTAELGGKTMLLVPGHGRDGTAEEVKARAQQAIENALSLAEDLQVKIVIENVWNHFLYDHEGGPDQTAAAMADFIDGFQSPFVAMQFDLGNHWKYGDTPTWVRTLGHRIDKLDIKGFSRQQGKFTDITKGDIPWGRVREALAEIGFRGWLAAEVGGGDLERLKLISRQMEEALHCSQALADVRSGSKTSTKS